jgi:dihydroxyacetone kinase
MSILTYDLINVFTKSYKIVRFVEGRLMTSLEMHGISITLFKVESKQEL